MTQPGIYARGDVVYETIDAVNYSTLKEFARSPAHYKAALEGRDATRTMRRGSLVHTAVFEPQLLEAEYAVYDGRRAGKAWDAFESANSDRQIVTRSEYDDAMRIVDAVRNDSVAGPLVRGEGLREPAMVWPHHDLNVGGRAMRNQAGIMLKGRPDLVLNDDTIVDLKTCNSAQPFDFSRAVARYQYHVQAAMYADGYEGVTYKIPRYVIVAVETTRPYDVVVYELGDDVLNPGRDTYHRYLDLLAECSTSGRWPGYANGLTVQLKLPPWVTAEESDLDALGLEM